MASGLVDTWNEDQLLRVHWLISHDYQSKNWKGSKSIKERFNLKRYKGRHKDLLEHLLEYISSLDRALVSFCDVAKPLRHDAFASFNDKPELRRQIIAATGKLSRMRAVASLREEDLTCFRPLSRVCSLPAAGTSEVACIPCISSLR